MPSRYCLTAAPDAVQAHFGYHNTEIFPPRDAIRPTEPAMIVRLDHRRRREAALVRWGLIPPWIRDFSKLGTLATARAETMADKPSFRGAIRHKRCLVPADGFFVWSGKAGRKQAHRVGTGAGDVMAFAGIYEQWLGADGSEVDSMAIITVPAAVPVSSFAPRMPAALPIAAFEAWLDCRSGRSDDAECLLDSARNVSFEVVED